jgi:hypothetical protein
METDLKHLCNACGQPLGGPRPTGKLLAKFGKKFVIAYLIIDNACSVAILAWYFSPWWPL